MSSEPAIEARGLGKAYPLYRRPEDRLKQLLLGGRRKFYEEFWAVRDVSLSIGRGETVGIIGRNGSGKSTLLQLICGTLKPSVGEVHVRGRVAALLELGSGFNPEFTGRENVQLGASVLGLSAEEIEQRFDSIAAFADIGQFMDQSLKRYSSGMHARLAFAVCANIDADVLIVDEILSVGDAAFQQKCMRFLNRFRLHGTLLFVSHDSGAIVKLCDRALWLDQGEVQGLGEAKEMCRLYLAAQAEETADEAQRFRIVRPPPRAPLVPEPAVVQAETSSPGCNFSFDADDDAAGTGGASVEAVDIRLPDGAPMHVAAGGEDIELRIRCTARRTIGHCVIAFVWRDRLGQILFSDDTSEAGNAQQSIAAGKQFTASFSFRLPYLSTGPYAIEAFLFDGSQLLGRKRDALILHVQSRHIFQQGLLNIAMRAVALRSVPQAPASRSRVPVNRDSGHRSGAGHEMGSAHGMGVRTAT